MPKVPIVTPNGPVIKDLRERAGLSRKQLGIMTGRVQQSIRRLEETREPASRLIVCQVAKALKVDVDELIRAEPETADEEPEVAA